MFKTTIVFFKKTCVHYTRKKEFCKGELSENFVKILKI